MLSWLRPRQQSLRVHRGLRVVTVLAVMLAFLGQPYFGQQTRAMAQDEAKPPPSAGEKQPAAEKKISFNRDIRSLLSDNCYACHGPDEAHREAGLRLDEEESTLAELESGSIAIVPGDSAESELVRRITAEDPFVRMPPADSEKELTPGEIELITKWIDQGAQWQKHWSFVAPQRPEPPVTAHEPLVRNPIDSFIFASAVEAGMSPSPIADKTTLIRRVTHDLTGLPPTLGEIDDFLADESPEAYRRVVERLLNSPRYGEQRARFWLDAARYGDTHGLHLDNERSLWPYRDWVIEAFNRNMPFDQFTIEQLAGDLLPDPTLDQRIATGFNRCNVTTSEGGSIDEEYYVRYAVDRVETTSTVWMGLTTGCAACHDHKFDPVTQKEFYQLFAYFNSIEEKAMDGNALLPPPTVKVPTPEQSTALAQHEARVAEIRQRIERELANYQYTDPGEGTAQAEAPGRADYIWLDDTLPEGAKPEGDGPEPWRFVSADEHPVHSGKQATVRTADARSQHYFTGAQPGMRVGEGDTLFAHVYLDPSNPPREIMLQWNDGSWEHRAIWGEDLIEWGTADSPSRLAMGALPEPGGWVRLEVEAAKVGLAPGAVVNGIAFTQHGGTVYWDTAGIVTQTPQDGRQFESLAAWAALERSREDSSLPRPVQRALRTEPQRRSAQQEDRVRHYFIENVYAPARIIFEPLHEQLAQEQQKLDELNKQIPGTMVMDEMDQPRDAFVLIRGEYDKKGDKVDRGVPAIFPPLPEDVPNNRLGLARWLVDPAHPLTARVTVNRFWQQLFGTGLVKTAEDFGVQGERPSHPELLDWLATELVRSGWDVKHMVRLMVTSHTYQQQSRITPEMLEIDPANRLLARGPRYRMDAEIVRDTALSISGLLVDDIGGPSVKPYQPPGLWEVVGYTSSNTAKFVQDHGENLFRRSMYTFWKRTSPPPTMLMFDAPSRETCTVRRARTNTPLQALALMNDTQYVEASRHLAQRMMTEGGSTPDERIAFAFRLATARQPGADEAQVLLDVYQDHLAEFQADPEAAAKLIAVGETPRDESLDPPQFAATTMVASLILNLDETITKQ
ncbi:MAG: PSD1 and planctomycete cytochrome C domain-containing protein [Pirellulales bacterium]